MNWLLANLCRCSLQQMGFGKSFVNLKMKNHSTYNQMIQNEDCSVFPNSKMLTSIHLCLYPAFTQSVHISWYAIFCSTASYTAVCSMQVQKGRSRQLHSCKYTWRKLPTPSMVSWTMGSIDATLVLWLPPQLCINITRKGFEVLQCTLPPKYLPLFTW